MPVAAYLAGLMVLTCGAAQSPLTAEEGAPVIPFEQAGEHIGQTCFVYGRVVLTKNIGSRCFLNFHPDYRHHFTVVINRANYGHFPEPPEKMYEGKDVKVFGRVIEYNGTPEIMVAGPDQITVLTDGFPTPAPRRPAVAATRRKFDGVARIATFNILNLFDGEDDPYHDDEGTPAKPREAIEKVEATIRQMDADVVALQEVENRFYLQRFVDLLLPDMGYNEVVLLEGNDHRGIDVAILSRFPVGPVTSHRHLAFPDGEGKPMSFRRDLLRARIEPPGVQPFDMFVVHLKSKGGVPEASLPIRLGEARAIRRICDALLAERSTARFVICGDFNDTIDSEPIKTIIGTGAGALRPATDRLAAADRITYNREPHRSQIDFVLCSPALAGCLRADSTRIVAGSEATIGSDHNPLVAEFDLRRP